MSGKLPVLISACLMGEPCRFDGQGKLQADLLQRLEDRILIPVCPEVEGGLPIPRPPAEIVGTSVIRQNGDDVTTEFEAGSQKCTETALINDVSFAILKSRSPACGCGQVYDGTFSKTLVEGDGIFTQSLKNAGFDCISDEQYLIHK